MPIIHRPTCCTTSCDSLIQSEYDISRAIIGQDFLRASDSICKYLSTLSEVLMAALPDAVVSPVVAASVAGVPFKLLLLLGGALVSVLLLGAVLPLLTLLLLPLLLLLLLLLLAGLASLSAAAAGSTMGQTAAASALVSRALRWT